MANELIEFVLVSVALLGVGIYGLSVKRNAIRMLFAVEIIVNAANLNLIAFARFMPEAHSGGQTFALFSIAIAAAEVAVPSAWFGHETNAASTTCGISQKHHCE